MFLKLLYQWRSYRLNNFCENHLNHTNHTLLHEQSEFQFEQILSPLILFIQNTAK